MVDGGGGDAAAVELPGGPRTQLSELHAARRSVKEFRREALDVAQLGAALRHAAGTVTEGSRTHASARVQYLVTVTAVVGEVHGLRAGAYRYSSRRHRLLVGAPGDHRQALADATVDASWLVHCPAILLLSADTTAADRSFRELGPRQGERFAWLEAGLIAQNLYLWAAGVGLGTVFVGGLDDDAIASAVRPLLPDGEDAIGLLPVGHPR